MSDVGAEYRSGNGWVPTKNEPNKLYPVYKTYDNYVYIYHTGILVYIPTFPEQISDSMASQFNPTTILGRSAPIMSYSSSGPRSMQIDLKLHRDMMCQIDYMNTSVNIQKGVNSLADLNDDKNGENYIDVLVRELQACSVPKYAASQKMIDPPMVAVRFGEQLFIKGVVNGGVGVVYSGPILEYNKYANVDVSFNVTEVDPYDADMIMQYGTFRGLTTDLERNIWKVNQ